MKVVVAVLFAATVFRDAHPLEPNPAVAHVAGRSNAAPFPHRSQRGGVTKAFFPPV